MKYDDLDLLRSLKEEDHQALKYVYQTYYPKMLSVLTQYGADEEDTKDIMQMTIIDLVRNIQRDKFRGESKLSTYFITMAKNKWYTLAKKNQKNVSVEITEEVIGFTEELYEPTSEEEVIKEVFEHLNPDCFKLLQLFYFEESSMKEIAKRMNYSDGFVRVKKNRCMEMLKKKVFDHSIIREKYPNALRTNK